MLLWHLLKFGISVQKPENYHMKDTCLSVLTIRGNTNNKIWGFFFKKKAT